MTTITTETFFLPREVERNSWLLLADIYNLYHSLYVTNELGHVFVPIRGLQFMAILDKNEIVFVDSQSYAVAKNSKGEDEGGRLILIAWQFPVSHNRDSLEDPMPCEVVFYDKKNDDLQMRLIPAFREAIHLVDQRYRETHIPAMGAKILTL